MQGLMMDYPLTLQQFFDRNQRLFASKEVISRMTGGMHRYRYAEYGQRVRRLANALRALGVQRGDRVGTFAWNTYRHLEMYFAVPCMGAVLHTVNVRLSAEAIAFIINDAGDKVLIVEDDLLPLIEPIRSQLTSVESIVVLQDQPTLSDEYLDYEAILAAASPEASWPDLDEREAAGICYSSGTTGNPKGVVYSHRAIYLHSMSQAGVDSMGLSESDRILPVVPMFHANGWGLPHAGVALGATMILPGQAPKPDVLLRLITDERVTFTAGVPTVWMGLLQELRTTPGYDLSSLRMLPCGGSAPPPSLIQAYEREVGKPLVHSWGMTETSPVATMGHVKSSLGALDETSLLAVRSKQGLPVLGLDLTILDDDGAEVVWDGHTVGEVAVRGPFVTAGYLHVDASDRFTCGWFRTGDVGVIDPDGYLQIVDRTKDLIKSGGEWISSVELENLIMGHPDVLEAAVIAVPHEIWGERPLALVVARPGRHPTQDDILSSMRPRVAKYAVPDEVRFVSEIPKTSVGKFDKKRMRDLVR